jgi:hypothetical protein
LPSSRSGASMGAGVGLDASSWVTSSTNSPLTSVDARNPSSEPYTVSTRHRFSSSLLSAASSVCGPLSSAGAGCSSHSSSIPGLGGSAGAGGSASGFPGSPHSSATTEREFPESAPHSSSLMGWSGFEGSSGAGGSARPTRRMSRPRCPGLGPAPALALALALAPSRGPWCAADAGAEARGAGTEVVGYGGGGGWVGGQDRMEGGRWRTGTLFFS